MRNIIPVLFIASSLLFVGCDKNELPVPLNYGVAAKVKINYASAYAANPTVQLKVNGERVSSSIKYAYPFPGGGLNTQGGSQPDYLSLPVGNVTLSLSIPKTGSDEDSVLLHSTSFNVPDDGYYTYHVTDTAANTQGVLLKENPAMPDSGRSKYRFVNLIPNLAGVDLYFGTTKVADNIGYLQASDYFEINFPTNASWAIRPAGADPSSTALATYANTTPNQRVLTVYARGYDGATDANRKPNVSLYYVR